MKKYPLAKNIWFKGALAISLYISCAAIAMFMAYGFVELFKGNNIPVRMYIVACVAIANWLVIAYYSEEDFWRTIVKLFCYSLALFSLQVFLLGVALIIKNFIDGSNQTISLVNSFLLMIVGALCIYGFVRLGNSKWLNS